MLQRIFFFFGSSEPKSVKEPETKGNIIVLSEVFILKSFLLSIAITTTMMMMMTSAAYNYQVAVVTGGNRGIGKEVCRQLFVEGYQVVLASRDSQKGQATAKEIMDQTKATGKKSSSSPEIHAIQLDVTSQSSVDRAVEVVADRYGVVDVLVNNGTNETQREDCGAKTFEVWQSIMNSFLRDFFNLPLLLSICVQNMNNRSY